MARPVSVTVVCWVIIAIAIEGLVGILSGMLETSLKEMLYSVSSPLSFSTTIIFSAAILAVTIILSILMLRGANWARIVYLCVAGITFIALLLIHAQISMAIIVMAFAKLVVFGTILFRPQANEFFFPTPTATSDDVAA